MKKIFFTLLLMSYLWSMNATDVMREVHKRADAHKTQKFDVSIVITDSSGKTRERFFTNSKQITKNDKRGLIKFYKPTNIKNTALLTITKHGDKNQWIYLPTFRTIKKLNTEDKEKSFMGSDFSYSDIAGRELEDDTHTMIKEDKKYYYIRSIPKSSSDSYSKLELIISKKLFVTLKVVFYDKNKKVLKVLTNKKFKKVKKSYFAVKSIMQNKKTGGKTELVVDDIKVDLDVGSISIKSLK